jgi:hypothetical protein
VKRCFRLTKHILEREPSCVPHQQIAAITPIGKTTGQNDSRFLGFPAAQMRDDNTDAPRGLHGSVRPKVISKR